MSYEAPTGLRPPRMDSPRDMKALLASFARYAALVRFQEAALEEDDLDRFEDLAKAREEIQEVVESVPPSVMEAGGLDQENLRYLEQVHEEVRDTLLRDARIRGRLQQMKKDASNNVRTAEGRGGQAREYLTGDEAKSAERPNQVNIRL